MIQTFKTEGKIKASLTKINRRGKETYDWVIEDEKNACNSCLICNHYKYNHDNHKVHNGNWIHICLIKAPEFIDITTKLFPLLNTSCIEGFSRRAIIK